MIERFHGPRPPLGCYAILRGKSGELAQKWFPTRTHAQLFLNDLPRAQVRGEYTWVASARLEETGTCDN